MSEFQEFPKMARWSRDVVITEKLDGTNAQIAIEPSTAVDLARMSEQWGFERMGIIAVSRDEKLIMRAGSRTRWITPGEDNYGFAGWAQRNAEELFVLGEGRHFGEWWGKGVQRNYSMTEKRFSLFNAVRWTDDARPTCCHVVPLLYQGPMFPGLMEKYIRQLQQNGSYAAPGFMNPEGIVLYHTAAGMGFKKTIEKDEQPKSLQVKES
jgi:hypothetical protein